MVDPSIVTGGFSNLSPATDLRGFQDSDSHHRKCDANEPRKKTNYFPLYWLVNRDPYNGLL